MRRRVRFGDGPFRHPTIEYETRTICSEDGTRLHVRVYGPADGEPVVLIHGFSCAIEYWGPQIRVLAAQHRVIAFDQRGHGRSGGFRGPVAATDLADDLAAVLRATLPDSRAATIVGHSMGGVTILAWAAKYPDDVEARVGSVLLANTAPAFAGETLNLLNAANFITRLQGHAALAILHTRLPLPPTRLARSVVRKVGLSASASPSAVELVQRTAATCPPRIRQQWLAGIWSIDVSDGVAALNVPTTVLYSGCDGLLSPEATKRLAAEVRAAGNLLREVELATVGHASNLEDIDGFNAEILTMVSQAPLHRDSGGVDSE